MWLSGRQLEIGASLGAKEIEKQIPEADRGRGEGRLLNASRWLLLGYSLFPGVGQDHLCREGNTAGGTPPLRIQRNKKARLRVYPESRAHASKNLSCGAGAPMKTWSPLLAASLILSSSAAFAAPGVVYTSIDHYATPPIWDNVGDGRLAGQTFLATGANVIGFHANIGNPAGPNSLGPLVGPADLVFLDAANLAAPVELARFQVVRPGIEIRGQIDFLFPAAIATTPNHRYFIGLEAADPFGIGMRSQNTSTYPDGEESFVISGAISNAGPGGRDLAFRILSREPGIAGAAFLTPPLCRSSQFSGERCEDAAPALKSFPVTAVLDHSGGYYSPDGIVKAFRTDLGCAAPPCLAQQTFGENAAPAGYRQDCGGTPFSFSGVLTYAGAGFGGTGTCPGGATAATSYLNYDGHSGYDFDTSFGDVILAAAPGILDAYSGFDAVLGVDASSFNALRIRHFNGAETVYLHARVNSQCAVAGLCNPGQQIYVRARQPIALAGNTGLGCGACTAVSCPCDHVHLEVRAADDPADSIDPFGCTPAVAAADPERCASSRLWLDGSIFRDGFESGETSAWQ